jgi:mannose-6-phosphate isomerase-like protein (cupin superfamily)
MKRRAFLQLPLVAAAISAADSDITAQAGGPALVVRAGADRDNEPFTWLDATFHVKVSGKDCGGRCVIFDTLRTEKVGPPLHLHTDCDEWFFVRDGQFKFQVATETMRLTTGDAILVPKNTPHAFVKTSDGTARLILMHQPAATMEEYFRTVITIADQTIDGRRALAERHGMRILGATLTPD